MKRVPKPFTRASIPPVKVEADRKKKHPRQDKHKGRSVPAEDHPA